MKTRIAKAYPDRIEVRGRDLAGDLMGRLSFTEYFHLLLTGREPSDDERFFLDLLLVAIAEHGLVPTNQVARMTLAADPASLQGAVAAGILGCGSVILGAAEACGAFLVEARTRSEIEGDGALSAMIDAIRATGGRVPGLRPSPAQAGRSPRRTHPRARRGAASPAPTARSPAPARRS